MSVSDARMVELLRDRIREASIVAERYGMIDGSHHKQWVIDQMLQSILREEKYRLWLNEMNSDPEYDPWDQGIAP